MKYLFLIYRSALPQESISVNKQAIREETYRINEMALIETGYIQDTGNLQSDSVTLRVRNNQLSFNEDLINNAEKELHQYYVVNARDLNEAIRVASNLPQAGHGSIEIRSIITD